MESNEIQQSEQPANKNKKKLLTKKNSTLEKLSTIMYLLGFTSFVFGILALIGGIVGKAPIDILTGISLFFSGVFCIFFGSVGKAIDEIRYYILDMWTNG